MSRTLKIFFIVLGLGIFILPKQVVFAQGSIECCDQKNIIEECCDLNQSESCHTENSAEQSTNDNCGDDCNTCHSCTVHFVVNFLSPELNSNLHPHFFIKNFNFKYGNSYFSSTIENIWQPPKIG